MQRTVSSLVGAGWTQSLEASYQLEGPHKSKTEIGYMPQVCMVKSIGNNKKYYNCNSFILQMETKKVTLKCSDFTFEKYRFSFYNLNFTFKQSLFILCQFLLFCVNKCDWF